MKYRIIFTLIILSLFVSCKETSEKKPIKKEIIESTDVTEISEEIKNIEIDINDIPKKWTNVTEYANGEYVIFEPCDRGIYGYSIEKQDDQWVLHSEGSHDITTYPIISYEIDSAGDLVFTLKTQEKENPETYLVIGEYLKDRRKYNFEFVYEDSYELYTNELHLDNYKKVVQPCYECVQYCPEENPNFLKENTIANDQFINPGKNVGIINHDTTPVDISSLFNEQQIIAHTNAPFDQEVTHINLGDGNELYVHWTEKPYKISHLRLAGDNSTFKTKEGVGIGNTIGEVENMLWTQFQIRGFEIDRDLAGTVVKWNNPEYNQLQLKFKTTNNLPFEQYEQIMGDDLIPSNHYIIQQAGLVVEEIVVLFNGFAATGEEMYRDSELTIFDNKTYYNEKELYNGTKDLLELIENEDSPECPVSYTYLYNPLSLLGNYYSYEKNESGSYACGPPSHQTSINTIDISTNERVEIQDIFTEQSILEALKKDTWLIGMADEFNKDLSNLNSLDDLVDFLDSFEVSFNTSSFAILKKEPNTPNVLVRLIGFRHNPIDKVVLGLTLKTRVPKKVKDLKFGLGTFNSETFPKK